VALQLAYLMIQGQEKKPPNNLLLIWRDDARLNNHTSWNPVFPIPQASLPTTYYTGPSAQDDSTIPLKT
jgi:hypothetical protein